MNKDKKSYITEFSEEEKRLNDEATLKALTAISDAMRAEMRRKEKREKIRLIIEFLVTMVLLLAGYAALAYFGAR